MLHSLVESRQIQTLGKRSHRLRVKFLRLGLRVVDGRRDEILDHLPLSALDQRGIDLELEDFAQAVDGHLDHSAARGALGALRPHLLLHFLHPAAHLLGLLEHGSQISESLKQGVLLYSVR